MLEMGTNIRPTERTLSVKEYLIAQTDATYLRKILNSRFTEILAEHSSSVTIDMSGFRIKPPPAELSITDAVDTALRDLYLNPFTGGKGGLPPYRR